MSYLKSIRFSCLSLNQKLSIKETGRPTPNIFIQQKCNSRKKIYTRTFNRSLYDKTPWLCGCDAADALFCYPCLLLGGDATWTRNGVRDHRHLTEKITKLEKSIKQMSNTVDLTMVGNVNIAEEIDSGYRLFLVRHNERVTKNRDALSKIIDCLKFCRKLELPLRGHDESAESENPGGFQELVNFSCSLDSSLDAHLRSTTVFKGTSKAIQNELLDSSLQICKDQIRNEVKNSEYLAIISDKTTDVFVKQSSSLFCDTLLMQNPLNAFGDFLIRLTR